MSSSAHHLIRIALFVTIAVIATVVAVVLADPPAAFAGIRGP
ncbi:hypothetical protein GCM10009557_09290 [Virgisporangium ochraceum]|uniref:Uncharacterized protein n=1 Tax=Virgisporangium ochraceum TaxID=65505 RepID=A0A8J3ZYX3_9ACTN|nr:hypothetical protein [Virgisporangium ochraceum]GIJ71422.1 hypothetical protein Voc01_063390 [Virgisporangium ochraceum]